LDDPLSAVDIKVNEHLFNQGICQLLRDKIRIMVTHDKNHMKAADQIIIFEKGTLLGKGTFSELEKDGDLKSLNDSSKWYIDRTIKNDYRNSVFQDSMPEHLETLEEDRDIGAVSPKLYWEYFKAGMHPATMVLLLIAFLLIQGKYDVS